MTGADEYQATHMESAGGVLLLDKTRSRGLTVTLGVLGGVMMLAGAGVAITALTAGMGGLLFAAGAAGLGGAVVGGCGVIFSVLRVTVTRDVLHVQLGMSGPRIPIADIVDCTVEDYEMLEYGGFGVKARRVDGRLVRAYTVPTAKNRVVRVTWREGDDTKSAVFSSDQPDVIREAVERAQMMRAGGGAFRARVEVPAEPAFEGLAADEAVADAEARARSE